MKTICFLTRCHPARPNMQGVCIDSIKNQTCDDWQQILIQGAMRESDEFSRGDGTFAIEHGLTKPWSIDARYVMVLDDDNMLVYVDFVKEFKELVEKENPDIVFFKGTIKGHGIYPPDRLWGKAPVGGCIDWFNFAIRREMWVKYIAEIEARPNALTKCNDDLLIGMCYQNAKIISWFDQLATTTQRGPGRSRPETAF